MQVAVYLIIPFVHIIIKKQLACSANVQASRSNAFTSAAYVKKQLDLDASRGVSHSYLLCTISLRSSLPVVQAGRSNAFTSAAYVKTQLDLDASRGVSHSYLLCTLSLRSSLSLLRMLKRSFILTDSEVTHNALMQVVVYLIQIIKEPLAIYFAAS